ncbi:MAG: alkyl hydroperoxide reductase/Thiol specific antioxidant/Mal allergen [Chthonomonadaceae bacterium]|nr:alkyl hydroperoxide reductase/Thiol specific antioxidant/Mal allergen [Chthonomonadaceae bacterium]
MQQSVISSKRTGRLVRFILVGVIGIWVVVGGAVMLALRAQNEAAIRPLVLGVSAPVFVLNDQYGHRHNLADYKGRGVVLAFLPGRDANSLAELRSLNAAMREFDTLGVKVFGITQMPASAAKALHDSEHLDYPLLTDTDGQIAHRYGAVSDSTHPGRVSYVVGFKGEILLPVRDVQPAQHGKQMISLAECCLDETTQQTAKNMGKPIADFQLPEVRDGKVVSLLGDRKQQATVLLFVSSLCPCSAKYDDRNVRIAAEYASKGVRFVAVNSSFGEQPAEIAAHARQARYPFPMLRDEGNVIADRVGAQLTPEAFVLDSKGVLRYHGRIDDNRDALKVTTNDLRNALDALLAGKLPPKPEQIAFGCAISRTRPLVSFGKE